MITVKTMGAIEIEIHLLDLFVVFAQFFFAKNVLQRPPICFAQAYGTVTSTNPTKVRL